LLGIHLCVIRHWIGGNAIITQGGLFIKTLDAGLGHYTSIIINSIQFIFIIICIVYIQKIAGKRPLFLISITCLSLLDIALAVAMIYSQVVACEMIMCFYMAIYGASFISPIWSYPSEIIPASQSTVPNVIHWLALAISTLVPPVITGIMPNNNAYPVFIFFGIYGLLSFIHVFSQMKESDGKSYNEIIKSFK
jgi:MFS family permease